VGTSIHSKQYRALLVLIRGLREDAGLTQAELAKRLDRPQSWISKVEVGERRIDIEELRLVCTALEVDFLRVVRLWIKAISG
jgi:transcriptional regulator with XRE-family HTH domain